MNLAQQIRQIAQVPGYEPYSAVAEVLSISGRLAEVRLVKDGGELSVRLQATEGLSSGFCIFPKVGSFVVVVFLGPSNGFVGLCSDVDKIELGGSDNGSVIIVSKLSDEVKKLSDQITLLRDAINAAPTVPADGGSAFKAALVASLSGLPFFAPDISDGAIGNPIITH